MSNGKFCLLLEVVEVQIFQCRLANIDDIQWVKVGIPVLHQVYLLDHQLSYVQNIKSYFNGEVKVKVAQSCPTLCNPMDYTVHGILPGQNTGMSSCSLLQGIFPTQGLNPGFYFNGSLGKIFLKGVPTTEIQNTLESKTAALEIICSCRLYHYFSLIVGS